MQTSQPSVFARDHTLFGVCEALGEDLGFNPVFLRIAFALGLFFNAAAVLAVYAGLGALVAFTRLVAPNPREAKVAPAEAGPAASAGTEVEAEPDVALAA
ncbi:MAG: phage shock protein [Sphingomonadales bacterium]|jgi:phage shock protein PspC (stress-responsive transcriptional regulator)|nr:phage shock protein [Sphingomonadales bacterium]